MFFDIETTGGNPQNSSIIEIAGIKSLGSGGQESFHSFVNPERRIPHIVRKLTGISNEQVKDAPKIEDVFIKFMDFIGNATLVSHGASSDVSFLKHYSKLFLEKKFNNIFLCTHLLTQSVFPKLKNKTLSGVAEFFNISLDKVHNARDDADTTHKIFWKILAELQLRSNFLTLEELLKLQGDR